MTISPSQLLIQLRLGALCRPQETREVIVVRVGCRDYACRADAFTDQQAEEFRLFYYAGGICFDYPGDFTVAPAVLKGCPLRTRACTVTLEDGVLRQAWEQAQHTLERWKGKDFTAEKAAETRNAERGTRNATEEVRTPVARPLNNRYERRLQPR